MVINLNKNNFLEKFSKIFLDDSEIVNEKQTTPKDNFDVNIQFSISFNLLLGIGFMIPIVLFILFIKFCF